MSTSLLDSILNIIETDVKRIKTQQKQGDLLDKNSASNLVDYGKLLMATETHQLKLEQAVEAQEINAKKLPEVMETAKKLIAIREAEEAARKEGL